MVTDGGLEAEPCSAATTDFELLCDNLVIPFFSQNPNRSKQKLEIDSNGTFCLPTPTFVSSSHSGSLGSFWMPVPKGWQWD